jgi:hypothetical protein
MTTQLKIWDRANPSRSSPEFQACLKRKEESEKKEKDAEEEKDRVSKELGILSSQRASLVIAAARSHSPGTCGIIKANGAPCSSLGKEAFGGVCGHHKAKAHEVQVLPLPESGDMLQHLDQDFCKKAAELTKVAWLYHSQRSSGQGQKKKKKNTLENLT